MYLLTKAFVMLKVLAILHWSQVTSSEQYQIELLKETAMNAGFLNQPVTSYMVSVGVGTPPKPFNMLVDINAREIWLPHFQSFGVVFRRLNYRDGYAKKESSSGLKEPEEVYTLEYEGIELAGKAYRDQFQFNNVIKNLKPLKYEQRFLAISSASNDKFTRFAKADGVIPLSVGTVSSIGSPLPSVALITAKLTKVPTFVLALNDETDSKDGGVLTLGGIEPQLEGRFAYHQVVSQHFWEVKLQDVLLNQNRRVESNCNDHYLGSCTARLSTTNNDLYGPEKAVKSILVTLGILGVNEKFNSAKTYEIDCLKVATAPNLTFVIDGQHYTIPASSYIRKKVDGLIFKTTSCYVSLLSNDSSNMWELGTHFLSNFYAVFDAYNRRLSFVKRGKL